MFSIRDNIPGDLQTVVTRGGGVNTRTRRGENGRLGAPKGQFHEKTGALKGGAGDVTGLYLRY